MLGNALLLALRELRRNVMRSFLTMLGIIIGVASVIILVTLGGGATRQVTEQIASLGSNLLMIHPGKHMGPGQSSGAAPFKLADAEALARDIPSLVAVAPAASSSMMAILANENRMTAVTGSTEQYFTLNNRKIKEGRVFSGCSKTIDFGNHILTQRRIPDKRDESPQSFPIRDGLPSRANYVDQGVRCPIDAVLRNNRCFLFKYLDYPFDILHGRGYQALLHQVLVSSATGTTQPHEFLGFSK